MIGEFPSGLMYDGLFSGVLSFIFLMKNVGKVNLSELEEIVHNRN